MIVIDLHELIKKYFGRVAQHNKNRWEWIDKGKNFKELNEKNSTYRKNIVRKTYQKKKITYYSRHSLRSK